MSSASGSRAVDPVVSKDTNELKTGAPGRFELEVPSSPWKKSVR